MFPHNFPPYFLSGVVFLCPSNAPLTYMEDRHSTSRRVKGLWTRACSRSKLGKLVRLEKQPSQTWSPHTTHSKHFSLSKTFQKSNKIPDLFQRTQIPHGFDFFQPKYTSHSSFNFFHALFFTCLLPHGKWEAGLIVAAGIVNT